MFLNSETHCFLTTPLTIMYVDTVENVETVYIFSTQYTHFKLVELQINHAVINCVF